MSRWVFAPVSERASGSEWLVVLAAALALSLAYTSPLFTTWSNWGERDWDQHLSYHAVPYRTVVEYGQFPLWNPYVCGGMVMHANPQARVLSPFFPLHLAFGFLAGIKLEIIAHLILGLVGAYALGRYTLRSRTGAAVTALVFMLSGMYSQALAGGMTWFLSVAYVPPAFLCLLKSRCSLVWVWGAGASLALAFFCGGAYVVVVTVTGMAIYALADAWQHRHAGMLTRAGLSVVAMLGLGAVKFVSTMTFLGESPRKISDYSGYSVAGLYMSMFARATTDVLDDSAEGLWHGYSYGADENFMYVGALAALLFVLGVAIKHEQRLPWLAVVLGTLWLCLGDRPALSSWRLAHELPVFDSMRVAQRFRIVMMLAFAILCGLGAANAQAMAVRRFRRARWPTLAGLVLVCGLAADLVITNRSAFAMAFAVPPIENLRPGAFRQLEGTRTAMLPLVLRNLGSVACYESSNVTAAAVPSEAADYQGEVFLSGTTGRVDTIRWSPNHLRLNVSADGPGQVVVNQNADSGWIVEQGNEISRVTCRPGKCDRVGHGVLGIDVSAGETGLDVVYRPRSFFVGLAISIACVLALVISVFRQSARRRR